MRAIQEQNQPFEIVAEDAEEGQNSDVENKQKNEGQQIVEENKKEDSFFDGDQNSKQIDGATVVPIS